MIELAGGEQPIPTAEYTTPGSYIRQPATIIPDPLMIGRPRRPE